MRRALWIGGLMILGLWTVQCGSDDSGTSGAGGTTAGSGGSAGGDAGLGGSSGKGGSGGTAGAGGGGVGGAQGGTAGQAGTAQGGTAGQAGTGQGGTGQGGIAGQGGTSQGGTAGTGTGGQSGGGAGQAGSGGIAGSAGGGGTPSAFSCLGTVTWPAPLTTQYTIQLEIRDSQYNTSLPGMQVRACKKTDTTCANPEATGTTNSSGVVTLQVGSAPEGVDAYFEITGTNYVPSLTYLYFTNTSVFTTGQFFAPVLATSTLSSIAAYLGVTLDTNRGNIVFRTHDCTDQAAEGCQVKASSADATSQTMYAVGTLPSPTATQTDSTGTGVVLNVPPGAADITGTIAANSQQFGSVPVLVRAGYLTMVNVVVTPK